MIIGSVFYTELVRALGKNDKKEFTYFLQRATEVDKYQIKQYITRQFRESEGMYLQENEEVAKHNKRMNAYLNLIA